MPSLHFGYSLLIGLTIMSIPLQPQHRRSRSIHFGRFTIHLPSLRRLSLVTIGTLYPAVILLAIIATANHFILDAVAGACVCGLAWKFNKFLLNLQPLEDWFLFCLRIHKPVASVVDVQRVDMDSGRDGEMDREVVNGKGVIV